MSASSMAAQGEKTRAKILKKLGKKGKTSKVIAEALDLSEAYVRSTLKAAVNTGKAKEEKVGRQVLFTASETSVAQAYKSVGSFAD